MRSLLLLSALSLYSAGLFAQSDTGRTATATRSAILSGNTVKEMVGKIDDENVYDAEGNILDHAAGEKLLRTYEYRRGITRVKGQNGLRKSITRIDPAREEMILKMVLSGNSKPISPKLQLGEVLDATPFEKKLNGLSLNGKALVLLFWCGGCYPNPDKTGYDDINYITGKFANPDKFEVLAITHQSLPDAEAAMKKLPILNARHIFNGWGLTDLYETNNKALIVITDKDHKITYAAKNWLVTTDRFLYRSLEAL
ncbi:hypothetical protein [Mucilaginibacter myungsuensis]|uniref:Peroxiredoxin n=1 Tax=Mucilaginibacter myungsuensis TaxID=649104 RepID=A0A929KW87_9SPHI|nr:hypothetical protein [Mucilaginibacter myungsuensis]MBE9661588.1 hypothetical protein [Mucilaginibacter myungsuensis]MDN3597733.1 hypothetical protein [Mucilaginibacter myungsuensis]